MPYLNSVIQKSPLLLAIFLLWSISWKGVALWKASKKDSKFWFIIILTFNTVGLLEIAYIFFLQKINMQKLASKINLSPLLAKLKKGKIR